MPRQPDVIAGVDAARAIRGQKILVDRTDFMDQDRAKTNNRVSRDGTACNDDTVWRAYKPARSSGSYERVSHTDAAAAAAVVVRAWIKRDADAHGAKYATPGVHICAVLTATRPVSYRPRLRRSSTVACAARTTCERTGRRGLLTRVTTGTTTPPSPSPVTLAWGA
ncbi:hypothetical protein VTO73DRAFT_2753 [Trametes versicolor]